MLRWLLPLTALSGLTACPGFGDKSLAELSGVESATTTYLNGARAALEANCTRCHGDPLTGGAPFPLDTYERASAKADRIRARAVLAKTMPPGGGVPDDDLALLDDWVQSGAPLGDADGADAAVRDDAAPPDQGPEPDAAPPPDEGPGADADLTPLTWVDDIDALIERNCRRCHTEPLAGGAPFPFPDYASVVAKAERIRVRAVDTKSMPADGLMTQADRDTLERWLDDGLVER